MKIKKQLILAVACCAFAMSLGACSDKDEKADKKTNAKANAKADAKAETAEQKVSLDGYETAKGNAHVAEAERQGLKLSDDKKTVTGVESKDITSCVIPYGVTSIGDFAFEECRKLTSVTIPDSVTSIGVAAFADCSRLTSLTIPNSVTSIGAGAFEDCNAFRSITIPNSVISIGAGAFADCNQLVHVRVGDGVRSIEVGAFIGCDRLTVLSIPNHFSNADVEKWFTMKDRQGNTSYKMPPRCNVSRR